MQWYHVLYLSIYAVLIVFYAIIKCLKLKKLRAPVKITLALMFVTASVVATALNFDAKFLTTSVALFFASIGDVFLLFTRKGRKYFHRGVIAFGIANAVLIFVSIWRFGFFWYSIPIILVCQSTNILLQYKKVFNYGKSKVLLNIYMPLVGVSGIFGLCIVLAGAGGVGGLLFGLGTLLFFLSDILLGLYNFLIKKWQLDATNSLLYFSGVMLIALSLFF